MNGCASVLEQIRYVLVDMQIDLGFVRQGEQSKKINVDPYQIRIRKLDIHNRLKENQACYLTPQLQW